MRLRNAIVIIAFAIGAPSWAPLRAMSDAQEMPAWMIGAWTHEDGSDWADEYWTPPRGDMMIGGSRAGSGEALHFWEQMRIQKEDDGMLALWVTSGNQNPVRFVATMSGAERILFENTAHDYPQRIEYWREGSTLMAEISLLDGSNAKRFGFSRK